MRISLKLWLVVVVSFAASVMPALAGPQFTGYDVLDSFNAITSGNFTTTSETEGAILVGGNLSPGPGGVDNRSGSAAIATALTPYFSRVDVYGNASGSWTVTAGDSVLIGGSNSATFANAGSVVAGTTFQISASAVQTALTSLSSSLAGQTGTAITPDGSGVLSFAGPQTGATDVFTLSLTQLQSANAIAFSTGSDNVVINVTGAGSYTEAANFTGSVNSNNIIWNFENATALNFGGFDGTVLALDAAVTNTSAINGTVASASFTGSGELHSHAFNAPPPSTPPVTPPPTSVPEPASAGVLLVAMLAIGASRAPALRRRSSRSL